MAKQSRTKGAQNFCLMQDTTKLKRNRDKQRAVDKFMNANSHQQEQAVVSSRPQTSKLVSSVLRPNTANQNVMKKVMSKSPPVPKQNQNSGVLSSKSIAAEYKKVMAQQKLKGGQQIPSKTSHNTNFQLVSVKKNAPLLTDHDKPKKSDRMS